MRKFYSKHIGEAFVLYPGQQLNDVPPKIEVKTKILPLRSLDKETERLLEKSPTSKATCLLCICVLFLVPQRLIWRWLVWVSSLRILAGSAAGTYFRN